MIRGFILAVCAALFTAVALGKVWINTPIVVMHYPDGKCIRVDSPREEDTCENLPARFTYEWSGE